jgi:gas vesicle protein
MVLDVLSFLAGVVAGGITGALAMVLHGLEKTADLQERLRGVTQEVERIQEASSPTASNEAGADTKAKAEELRRELDEIHGEIRRMYKRSSH